MPGRGGPTKEELTKELNRDTEEFVMGLVEDIVRTRWSRLIDQIMSEEKFQKQLREIVRKKLGAVLRDLHLTKGRAYKELTIWGWTGFTSTVYEKPWDGDPEGIAIMMPREPFDEMDIGQRVRVAHKVVEYPGLKVAYMVFARTIGPYFDARMGENPAPDEVKGTLHVIANRPPPEIDPVLLKLVLIEGWSIDVMPVVRMGPGPTGNVLVCLPPDVRVNLGIKPGDKLTVFFRVTKDAVLELAIPALAEEGGSVE